MEGSFFSLYSVCLSVVTSTGESSSGKLLPGQRTSSISAATATTTSRRPRQSNSTQQYTKKMREQGYAALNWTVSKAKAASRGTYSKATNLVSPALRTCSPVAQAVCGKSKDLAGVAVGTVALQTATVPMINLLGFSAAGPTAASWAAYTMSLYGGAVPAGWSRVPIRTSNRLQLTDLGYMQEGCMRQRSPWQWGEQRLAWECLLQLSVAVTLLSKEPHFVSPGTDPTQHPPALKVPQSTRRRTDTKGTFSSVLARGMSTRSVQFARFN